MRIIRRQKVNTEIRRLDVAVDEAPRAPAKTGRGWGPRLADEIAGEFRAFGKVIREEVSR